MKILNVGLSLEDKERNFGINFFHGIQSAQATEAELINRAKEQAIENLQSNGDYLSPINYYKFNNVIKFDPVRTKFIDTNFKDSYRKKYHNPLKVEFEKRKDKSGKKLSSAKVPDLNLYLGLLYKIDDIDMSNSTNYNKPVPTRYFSLYQKKYNVKGKKLSDRDNFLTFKSNNIVSNDLMSFIVANPVKTSETQTVFDGIALTEFKIKNVILKQEISYREISISNSSRVDAIKNVSLVRFDTNTDTPSSSILNQRKSYFIDVLRLKFNELRNIKEEPRRGPPATVEPGFPDRPDLSRKKRLKKYIRERKKLLNYNKSFYKDSSDDPVSSPYNDTFIFSFLDDVENKNLDLALTLNKFSFSEFTNNNLSFLTLSEDFRRSHIANIQKEIMLYYASKNQIIHDNEISDYLFAFVYLLNEKINKGESYIEDLKNESDSAIQTIKLRIRSLQYHEIKIPFVPKFKDLFSFFLQRGLITSDRVGGSREVATNNLINLKSMLEDENVKIYVDRLYRALFYYKDMSSLIEPKELSTILNDDNSLDYNLSLEEKLFKEFNNAINFDPIT